MKTADAHVAGAGGASRPHGPPPGGGHKRDGDGDAEKSSSSSANSTNTQYDALDINKDGKVSMSEVLAGLAKEAETTSNNATKTALNTLVDAFKSYANTNKIDLENTNLFSAAA